MKRFFSLFLVLTIVLTACSAGSDTQQSRPDDSTSASQGSPGDVSSVSGLLDQEVSGEINVFCYDTMAYQSFLEEAARMFEAKHPGTKVNIETFSKMPEIKTMENEDGTMLSVITAEDDPQAISDYRSRIGTELMSGGGADVLAMDVLPYYQYAEAGRLEDLSRYMEADPDFRPQDYLENIFDGARYQGGLYLVPIDYGFSYLAYDGTLLDDAARQAIDGKDTFTTEELFALAADSFQAASALDPPARMLGMSAFSAYNESLYRTLLDESMEQFVDIPGRTARFDDGEFARMLEAVKEYDSKGYLKEQTDVSALTDNPMDFLSAQNREERFLFKNKGSYNLISEFDTRDGLMFSFGGADSGVEDDDVLAGLPANTDGSVPFFYTQAFGLNAGSQNKRTAWEFIKFLLSDEVADLSAMRLSGQPVNNAAREARARDYISGALFASYMEDMDAADFSELTPEQQAVFDAYFPQLEAYSRQLNFLPVRDSVIEEMIADEVESFFTGSRTADEVAGAIQSKVALYLNE